MILNILEQARKEVKGNELNLTIDGKIDINATIQGAENIFEVSKRMPINMLVIGMVAARVGVNPTFIMSALASSYYKNHNGFNGVVSDEATASPVNLIKNYDWSELESKHNEIEVPTNQLMIDALEIKDEDDKNEARQNKIDLLDSLRKMGKKINS